MCFGFQLSEIKIVDMHSTKNGFNLKYLYSSNKAEVFYFNGSKLFANVVVTFTIRGVKRANATCSIKNIKIKQIL